MKKLSDLTRRENCFFTVDNRTLKTVQDLLEYLVDCDENAYRYHVNSQKNDFANWVGGVLLFPELAESLKISKNINEARDAIMEFFQVFDYRSKWINEEKSFHTVDGYGLKNIQELYYYLNNCDDGAFQYHVNSQKNDFANWVSDVLLFPSLAAKMRSITNKSDFISVLKEFLTASTSYGANPEYERYMAERLLQDTTGAPSTSKIKGGLQEFPSSNSSAQETQEIDKSNSASITSGVSNASAMSTASTMSTTSANNSLATSASTAPTVSTSSISQKNEETITFDKKFEYVREDEPEKPPEPSFDKNGFRQYTDEELEKFMNFARTEKTTDTDLKVEYLKTALQELKNMVKDLRRAEKDPLIADLMLRSINAKIDFYATSKNVDDYNHIIRLMKDVQHEIEQTADQHTYNIAEELFKDLRLQGIAMKKV